MTTVDLYEDFSTLSVAIRNGVAWVTLDNGDINLLDRHMFREIAALGPRLADDERVRVVVLQSANPDFFIAHFDVSSIQRIPLTDEEPSEPTSFHAMCESFRVMPKATICKIAGRVGGGGSELAMSFDMRFAAIGRAVFNQPEVALGILPGGSGTQRLPQLMGRSRALEVILGCEDFDAVRAERYGWINQAMPAEDLDDFVERLANRIAGFPTHAVAAAKASVLEQEGDMTELLRREAAKFQDTLHNSITQEVMQEFLERGGQTVRGELALGELCAQLRTPAVGG